MLVEKNSDMKKYVPFVALAFSIFAFFMGRYSTGKLTDIATSTEVSVDENGDYLKEVLLRINGLEQILESQIPIDDDDLNYIAEQTNQIESELRLQEMDDRNYSNIYRDLSNIRSRALSRWKVSQGSNNYRNEKNPITIGNDIPITENGTKTKTVRIPVDSVSNFSNQERINRFNN